MIWIVCNGLSFGVGFGNRYQYENGFRFCNEVLSSVDSPLLCLHFILRFTESQIDMILSAEVVPRSTFAGKWFYGRSHFDDGFKHRIVGLQQIGTPDLWGAAFSKRFGELIGIIFYSPLSCPIARWPLRWIDNAKTFRYKKIWWHWEDLLKY